LSSHPNDTADLLARLNELELKVRRQRYSSVGILSVLAVFMLLGAIQEQPQDTIRARVVIVEDDQGRDRIVLGAPMLDGREYVGMKILNPDGAEQFGLGLKNDGSVSMGFDVRPGVGNPANRERLNMGVTASGQGWIRYLDNDTKARMFIRLDSEDVPELQFLDWPDTERIVVREIGFVGESSFEWQR